MADLRNANEETTDNNSSAVGGQGASITNEMPGMGYPGGIPYYPSFQNGIFMNPGYQMGSPGSQASSPIGLSGNQDNTKASTNNIADQQYSNPYFAVPWGMYGVNAGQLYPQAHTNNVSNQQQNPDYKKNEEAPMYYTGNQNMYAAGNYNANPPSPNNAVNQVPYNAYNQAANYGSAQAPYNPGGYSYPPIYDGDHIHPHHYYNHFGIHPGAAISGRNPMNPYYGGTPNGMNQMNPYYGGAANMYNPYGNQPMGWLQNFWQPGFVSYWLRSPRVNNFFRGVGIATVAMLLAPAVARAFRPLAVSAVEGALSVSEEVKNIFSDAKEDVDDIFAEAKWQDAKDQEK